LTESRQSHNKQSRYYGDIDVANDRQRQLKTKYTVTHVPFRALPWHCTS